MLRADILLSGFAVSVLLVAFYSAIAMSVIAFQGVFGFTLHQANAIGNWMWAANAVAVVGVGFASDRLGVRKPFMLAGAVITGAAIVVYLQRFGHPTGYATLTAISALLCFGLGVAFTPWLASFSETVEARNPALTATGLAVWGLTLRVVTFAALGALPAVVTSVTPLVDFVVRTSPHTAALTWAGQHPQLVAAVEDPATARQLTALAALAAAHPAEVAQIEAHAADLTTLAAYQPIVSAIAADPGLFTRYAATPFDGTLASQVLDALGGGSVGYDRLSTLVAHSAQLTPALQWAQANPAAVAVAEADASLLTWAGAHPALVADATRNAAHLQALAALPPPVAAYARAHGTAAAAAQRTIPGQMRTWYWVCFGGVAVFAACLPLLAGPWRPRRAGGA